MIEGDRYARIVQWSDEDGCFIGTCPELFMGGCHGDDPRAVFDELCEIVEENIRIYEEDGKPLPTPLTFDQLNGSVRRTSHRTLTP